MERNVMSQEPLKRLFPRMGLPMIVSMILQALYNVVDSVFVTNMEGMGTLANEALTIAFPIQILMIAIGVGTGVGLNALLSKSLGEGDNEMVARAAGNGIFLALVIYGFFFLFGAFASAWFIGLFTSNPYVREMGTDYLRICTCLSLGSIGYTIYERFLQSTGKTLYSTVAQVLGALTNIILDYVFIFPLGMGVTGAAWATVIGQFTSLGVAMLFHYVANHEIRGGLKYITPDISLIGRIYRIGASAALMQALLSVMMAGMNAILGAADAEPEILLGAFGIYYKMQQIALFAAFGLSNTIITILSYTYGMRCRERSRECIRYGILDTMVVMLIITLLFEALADPLARLFALSGGSSVALVDICVVATRIAAIGFVCMGFSVAVQGVLQALGSPVRPLLLALLRLVIFVFPVAFLFTRSPRVTELVWWTFPIAEALTSVVSLFFLYGAKKRCIDRMD